MSHNLNIKPSDRVTVLDIKDPVSQAAATVTTGWIAARDYDNYLAVLQVGALGASGTVDAKLQQAQDGTGTGAKDITNKAITQFTQAGGDSNKQALVNLRDDELDIANAFTHFRLSITVGTAASLIGAVIYGLDARYKPGTHKTTAAQVIA